MNHAVILSGGSGTRLWPVSREKHPKQFQKLIGEESLLQQTFNRLSDNFSTDQIWIVTTEEYAAETKKQLPQLSAGRIITEPSRRNTAAAVALTAEAIYQVDDQAIVGIFPADHYIADSKQFKQTVDVLYDYILENRSSIGTIGIKPTEPNTGYGYIQMGKTLKDKIFKVESFHEKPDISTAQSFLKTGKYLWNAGIFVFNANQLRQYYKKLAPSILLKVQVYLQDKIGETYQEIEPLQFDRAIAEKASELVVIPAEMGWSDIGDWLALQRVLSDISSNQQSVSRQININAEQITAISSKKKLIATIGLSNLIIVDTEDALLVAEANSVQDVKKVVEKLQKEELLEYL